ncbi:MAG: hypothetical protein GMKNLPBB_01276 [Myxococcota bacterium]|nr:hypothetical protein [Myxococcota bacterium]
MAAGKTRTPKSVSARKDDIQPFVLTGAGGFIGKRLLPALLRSGWTKGWVIVRPGAADQIRAGCESVAGVTLDWSGLTFLEGDTTRDDLGVRPSEADLIAEEAVHIFHFAGVSSLRTSTEDAQRLIIDATSRVLDFAGDCVRLKRFHYLSSVMVSGSFSGVFLESMLDEGQRFDLPLAEAKFLAEQEIHSRTELASNIYRPSTVIGDSRTGQTERMNGFYQLLRILWRLKNLPRDVTIPGPGGPAYFNIAPIDYVTAAIAAIATDTSAPPGVFQLTDPKPLTYFEMCNLILERLGGPKLAFGVPLTPLASLTRFKPLQGLVSRVSREVGIPLPSVNMMAADVVYDTKNTRAVLAGKGVECPPLESYIDTIIGWYGQMMMGEKIRND